MHHVLFILTLTFTWSFLRVRIHTRGCWAHRQRVSTTFFTRKNSHTLSWCSRRCPNLGSLNPQESDALPIEPPQSPPLSLAEYGQKLSKWGEALQSFTSLSIQTHSEPFSLRFENSPPKKKDRKKRTLVKKKKKKTEKENSRKKAANQLVSCLPPPQAPSP